MRWSRVLVLLLIAVYAATACAPTAPGGGQQQQAASAQATTVDRPVRMAITNEPGAMAGKFAGGRSGLEPYSNLFAARLVRYDALRNPTPQLAESVPDLNAGTWRLLDEGRMETVYRLRNATWHDGTPLTPEDVIFTWRAISSPELPATDREPERFIEAMEATDANTVLMRWKQPYVYANSYEMEVLPRHILEPLLQRDPQSFVNAPYWTREWVGLGPYQLGDWVPGSYLKGQAFDGYVFGRPKISEIVAYFVSDANQAVARVLAGDLDLTVGSILKVEEGVLLKDRWEALGEGSILTSAASVRAGDLQFRDQPTPASRDARIRRGMSHALDRQLIVDTLHFGLTRAAHMYLAPNNAAFDSADRAIVKYLFDQQRALQLFAESGWTRGSDGLLRGAGGDRFEFVVRTLDSPQYVKEAQVVAEAWRNVGIDAQLEFYTRAQQNDREYRSKFTGIALGSPNGAPDDMTRWATAELSMESNNWRGANRGGYSRPDADGLINDYFATIDPAKRVDALVRFVRFSTEDLPGIAVYYPVDVYAVRAGLRGYAPAGPGEGWEMFNAHQMVWER